MSHDKPGVMITRIGDFDAPNKLAIGICTLGLIRVEHEVMMSGVGLPLGQAMGRIYVKGYGIQDARNIAWNAAEGQGYEYMMFWDDDVVPLTGGAVETLLETMEQNPEIDILGGVYPVRQSIPAPIVTKENSGKPWWGWEDGGIYKVWMTGTGFTMYRVSSIQRINASTKSFQTVKGPWEVREFFRLQDGTDDFALAVEAENASLTWYVHGAIVCDQIEPTGLRFEVKNARQRIGGKNDKGSHPARNHDSRPTDIRARRRGPADVRAG